MMKHPLKFYSKTSDLRAGPLQCTGTKENGSNFNGMSQEFDELNKYYT